MDEYDKKFAKMQKYIPFLEAMIERLQNVKDKSREIQLQKMQSLHGILSNSKGNRLRIETLERCEDVLQKLYNRVEKGNAPGLQLPTYKRNDGSILQPSTSLEDAQSDQNKKAETPTQSVEGNQLEETPASPDPSVSPDAGCQILPIIIPTERSADFAENKSDKESKIPVITITDRPVVNVSSSDSSHSDDVFTEWDMLEESQRNNTKARAGSGGDSGDWQQPLAASSRHEDDLATKLAGVSLPQKVSNNSDSRGYSISSRTNHIPTVPVPSLGGSRRLSSVLEKSKVLSNLDIAAATVIGSESPVNFPDARRKSPDPEILFSRPKILSPRSKDSHGAPRTPTKTKTPMPLLVSPPPISTEPPLSMEDLEELLGGGGDEKKGEKRGEDAARHLKKDSGKQETSLTKDGGKASKEQAQSTAERENERHWEEIDKHIIKLGGRKSSVERDQVSNAVSAMIAKIDSKSSEVKATGALDHHSSPSTSSKFEPRYADNYERHPRQRDALHAHENVAKDKSAALESACRDQDISQIPVLHGTDRLGGKPDDRIGLPLYGRRPSTSMDGWKDVGPPRSDNEFVIEGTDYYNMHLKQQMHWQQPVPPMTAGDHPFSDAQWAAPTYSGMANPPMQSYPHPMGMFMGGSPVDPSHAAPPGPRPLMNPAARPQDIRSDEIPSLMSSSVFPPQYRPFPMTQGSYDPNFDRPTEYPHGRPTWDAPVGRVEPSYNKDNIINCGISIAETPPGAAYSRSDTPCPWSRDRDRNRGSSRGRGRDSYYNERNRAESRPNFGREVRRPDRENPNRFGNRNAFERDPRIRTEHSAPALNQVKESSGGGSVRDPRLAKDKHFSPTKVKDAAHNERDPRKRSMSLSGPPSATTKKPISNKEKTKPHKLSEKRGDSESKDKTDKLSKSDKMQSPLESLYGVIDTKSSHGSGLQKFKIPKIKRPEPQPPPPPPQPQPQPQPQLPPQLPPSLPSSTTSHVVDDMREDFWPAVFKTPRVKSNGKKKGDNSVPVHSDDTTDEVSSTSNGSNVIDNSDTSVSSRQNDLTKEEELISSLVEETNKKKKRKKISSVDSATIGVKSMNITDKLRKEESSEADGTKANKEEVTQELIEALIRRSFECGEGKKLVEHAKLIRKLGEALQAKKLKKIQKIIASESESSSSDKDESVEPKKTPLKKKRRVIMSSSSDDESLAERLGILSANVETDEERAEPATATSTDTPDSTKQSAKSRDDTTASDNLDLNEESAKNSGERTTDDPLKNLRSEKSDRVQTDDSNETKESEASNARLKKINERNDVTTERYNDDDNQKIELQSKDSPKRKKNDRLKGNNEHIDIPRGSDKQLADQSENKEKEGAESQRADVDEAQDAEDSLAKDEADRTEQKTNEGSGDKPKAKTKRRNSLEMLQDDIREMFISEGVVTATGFRMCRLSKENQPSQPMSTATSSKKDEASSNASVAEPSVEADESTAASNARSKKTSAKSRNSGESTKSKAKGKKDAAQRPTRKSVPSKDSVQSSESEEDQPLALRSDWKQNTVTRSNNATPRPEEDEEAGDVLRRSKRVLRKEPRVLVERTDITKIDSSKIMFDTSSDESFSIDVSELAAAVDSSMRPDNKQQSDQESVDTVVSSRLRQRVPKRTGKRRSRRSASLLTDCKSDDGVSHTDEESVISDISMSSSTTAGKRRSAMKAAKEELLSNILVGLAQAAAADKATADDEADVDEDSHCLSPMEANVKKASVKKKKKKSSWQMGILTKKKRKKVASAASVKAEREEASNNDINDSSVSDDKRVTTADDVAEKTTGIRSTGDDATEQSANTDNSAANGGEAQSRILTVLSESSSASQQKEPGAKGEADETETKPEIEAKPEVEVENSTGYVTMHGPCNITEPTVTAKSKSSKVIVYDGAMEELHRKMKVEQLIEYAWTGPNKMYSCLLCFFNGKNIIHHYKIHHPDKEILPARFSPTDAQIAIEDGVEDNATSSFTAITSRVRKYRCRFCTFETEGGAVLALEAFYDHCTTHTGEYRFHCNSCTYQAVAKASMRTHYYKMCRKPNDTFYECTTEDPIPWQNGVCGYLCRECNYVQLKRENVVVHAAFWHRDRPRPRILKINMSISAANGTEKRAAAAAREPLAEEIKEETKPEVSVIEDAACKDAEPLELETEATSRPAADNATESREQGDEESYKLHEELQIEEEKSNDEANREETDARPTRASLLQGEPEGPVNAGNMSAFVCPPELEDKEVEIQLERKKRMQEIVDNIGIKINRNQSKSSLSITDKLQDKMRTDAADSPVTEDDDRPSTNVSRRGDNEIPVSVVAADSTPESTRHEGMIVEEDPLSESITDCQLKDPLATEQSADDDQSSNADKAELKIRDPLAIMDPCTNSGSDSEETVRRSPVYEMDSSSEQSDAEPTDVNMILKETSTINASSSRDPMLTTIQRLAAQLQGAKPPPEVPAVAPDVAVKRESSASPTRPRASDVASIDGDKQSLLKTQHAQRRETTLPILSGGKKPPKNFLRLRRLSGDMLSTASLDNLEDTQTSATDNAPDDRPSDDRSSDDRSSDDRLSDPSQTDDTTNILQTDTEEECSFLKIENVVSLAPNSNSNEAEIPIINDIRKAVEISPVKNKLPLLKKPHHPLILKKINVTTQLLANSPVVQPSTSDTLTLIPVKNINQIPVSTVKNMNQIPVSTKAVTTHLATNFVPIHPKPPHLSLDNTFPQVRSVRKISPSTNCKIFKVLQPAPVVKTNPTDVPITAFMPKLKSAIAYLTMTNPAKLVQFFKCMSRECYYTTDHLAEFCDHYIQHSREAMKQNAKPPYDYQKCAYCYKIMEEWTEVKTHMWEKHNHSQFQCGYCFYRAVAACYVKQHQAFSHANEQFRILIGKKSADKSQQETIKRADYVIPYVCDHDCSKGFYLPEVFAVHLGKSHSTSHSFKCHLCKRAFTTVKSLMNHYKTHGLAKYQCLYCLHGGDAPDELLQHLSVAHWNRMPQILERSFPQTIMRNTDVLSQLVLRSYNENGDLVNIYEKNTGVASPKVDTPITAGTVNVQLSSGAVTILTYTDQSNVEIAPSQDGTSGLRNNATSNTRETVDGQVGNAKVGVFNLRAKQPKNAVFVNIAGDAGNNAAISAKHNPLKQILLRPSLRESSSSAPNPENRSVLIRSQKDKPGAYATELLDESQSELLPDDPNAVDPLEFADEFVNTNLLDNPDFLKSLTANSGNASVSKDDTTIPGDKTEDSDIEILENVESTEAAAEKTNTTESEADQTTELDSSFKESTDKEEQSETGDATEDKDTSNEAAANEAADNAAAAHTQLLSLEDIKDTGCTGEDLYKCGYQECNFAAMSAPLLKKHFKECTFKANDKNLHCAHCKKRFIKFGFLLEHMKIHGVRRFGCSLCKMRFPVSYQATAHMKTKHKFTNTRLVPADPRNPSADGLFVVHGIKFGSGERKTKKRKGARLAEPGVEKAAADNEKLLFSPDEIDQLPRQAIYLREVQCAVCPYTTKVRTNIIRHLQLHAKDETVPETGPVNPVPCLDKKERMFDKMVNLASSSHQNGRMGVKTKEPANEDDENAIPKFVPEHKRYVCSVAECNYLTVDEAMLRYHLKALHSDEPYFRCPHCPPPSPGQESQNIAIDKMGVHLKMHDARLYKCSHCNHHHYQRYVVERHLTDKHPEKRPFVKVIRELDNAENNQQQTAQEENEEEVPDPDGNHWKCNLCDFKSTYKAEMSSHAATVHDEKCQFKCTVCSFKTISKILFEQHISSKHANDPNVDFILVYQRIKGVNKRNTEPVEQTGQDVPFDTTPIWRRDMPRIRHIRGILVEEEEAPPSETSSTSAKSVTLGKRKSETEPSAKWVKAKMAKSASLDENKQSKEKAKRSLSCEKLSGEAEDDGQSAKENKSDKTAAGKTANEKTAIDKTATDKIAADKAATDKAATDKAATDKAATDKAATDKAATDKTATDKTVSDDAAAKRKSDTSDVSDVSDLGRFGPYGKPDRNKYVCTLCNRFKTKFKHDMRDHLYRELNYARWHCKACGFLSVNRNALLSHFVKRHHGTRAPHEPLSPDNAIEDWVTTLLKKQTDMIKARPHRISVIAKNPAIVPVSGPEVINLAKTIYTDTKAVDLAPTITNLQNDMLQDADRNIDEIDDGDSRDDEDLVIDIKEEELLDRSNYNVPEREREKSCEKDDPQKLVCKHCDMTFNRRRGFKLHVQLTHLKRLGFLCPYCDRSTNSEQMIRQHMRAKHRGCEMKIIHNPAAGGPELTDEFWEKEYGLVCPLKVKKKRNLIVDDTSKDDTSKDDTSKADKSKDDRSKDDRNKNDKSKDDKSKDDKGSNLRLESQEKCEICGFTALNYTGLKSHMRSHMFKQSIKCHYCTYSCSLKAELIEHWKINHPSQPFRIRDNGTTTTGGESSGSGSSKTKKRIIEDYTDDIEEECVVSADEENSNMITMYSCVYCSIRSHSLAFLMRHWDLMHKQASSSNSSESGGILPFRYTESKVPTLYKREPSVPMKKEVEKLKRMKNADESLSSWSGSSSHTAASQKQKWICQWCQEMCETDNDMKIHQNMFHSHLPLSFKKQPQPLSQLQQQQQQQQKQQQQKQQQQQQENKPRDFVCSVCSYTSPFLTVMKKHVVRHVNLFKCKYCDKSFNTPVAVSAHSLEIHPGLPIKIDSISNFDSLVENLIKKFKQSDDDAAATSSDSDQKNFRGFVSQPRAFSGNRPVARKSTIKSVISYANPSKRAFKAVARKSTNPLPRFLRESTEYVKEWNLPAISDSDEEMESEQPLASHYGVPSEPIDLDKVTTYMKLGSLVGMTVSCTTLGQILKINPNLLLEDIRHDPKYAAIFSQHA